MSNVGKRILNKVKTPAKDIFDTFVDIIARLLSTFALLRIGVTIFLVLWLIINTWYLLVPGENSDPRRVFYTHQLWFGDQSIVEILSGMWYYAIFFIVLAPYLGRFIKAFKVGFLISRF